MCVVRFPPIKMNDWTLLSRKPPPPSRGTTPWVRQSQIFPLLSLGKSRVVFYRPSKVETVTSKALFEMESGFASASPAEIIPSDLST